MKSKTNLAKKRNVRMIVVALCIIIVILGVTIVYAALSNDLVINVGKTIQTSLSWDVRFEEGSVTPVEAGPSNTGRICGVAVVNTSTITVPNVTLAKKNDMCSYRLVVENNGKIDATLAEVTPISPDSTGCVSNGSSMVCGSITYMLTTDAAGENLLSTGGTLAKLDGNQIIYLVVKFSGTATEQKVEQESGGFTLVYVQK